MNIQDWFEPGMVISVVGSAAAVIYKLGKVSQGLVGLTGGMEKLVGFFESRKCDVHETRISDLERRTAVLESTSD